MSGPIVIKVGGSLLDWPPIGQRLGPYLETRRAERPIVIVGGGRSADVIRELDRIHGLGDAHSHDLAVRALDLTAYLLAALVPSLEVVDRAVALSAVWSAGRFPLLAPKRFLDVDDRENPLERSWDVTTDSIAARVAERLRATELILLKSAPTPPGIDRCQAAALGLLDRAFPGVSRPLDRVLALNFRDSEAVPVPLPRCLDATDGSRGESGDACPKTSQADGEEP